MNTPGLRVAFAGTPEFAATILAALLRQSRHRIVSVYTQPDRRAGRGRRVTASAVKQLALRHSLPVYQPESAAALAQDGLQGNPDVMVVAAYGLLLPAAILSAPGLGCINVHASLLPRWRGAAPVQRAIQAGDTVTGVSIMQMDEGLDTGDILRQQSCPIDPSATGAILQERLADIGAQCLVQTLADMAADGVRGRKQDPAAATYAPKIEKQEATIDWSLPAVQIERNVRAFNPVPAARTQLRGLDIRVLEAGIPPEGCREAAPGTVTECNDHGITVRAGDGCVQIRRLQLAGKRPIPVRDFLNARPRWRHPD